jgi:hypothetical protein
MRTVDFLERVLPESDQVFYYCQTAKDPIILSRHSSALEIYNQCLVWSNEGRDAHFAFAGFTGLKRDGESAVMARTLWLDLDCAKPRAGYPTLEEGLTKLFEFVEELGLPDPLIVCSGLGAHVYWPFDRDLPKKDWLWLARTLKRAVIKFGLKVDNNHTTNIASLPRCPETYNLGYDGVYRQVKIINDGEIVDPIQFGATLIKYVGDSPFASRPSATIDLDPIGSNFARLTQPKRDWDPLPIIRECAQIRRAGDALASRDSWLHMLGIMKFCKNGREVAHIISKQDPNRYHHWVLDQQFDSLNATGPHRCETFWEIDPTPCEDCRWRGHASTPIDAGRRAEPQAPRQAEVNLTPFRNDEFIVIPGQGLYNIVRPRADPGAPAPEPVYNLINSNEFYISEVLSDTENPREKRYIEFTVKAPQGQYRKVLFSAEEDLGRQNFAKWLANHGLLPIKFNNIGLMELFMGSYIAALQNQVTRERKSHFGWTQWYNPEVGKREDGFVIGDEMLTMEGSKGVSLSPKCQAMFNKEFIKTGDLETWKLIPEMYKVLDQKEAQLFICGSFAAPFMNFSLGTGKNLIMSMWDPRGGKGKTTLLQTINSVWGHPEHMTCSKSDTLSARYQVLSARKNLPFCMDELTTMNELDLSNLLYDVANGLERRKSTRSGAELQDTGSWSTLTFVTSNRSIHELMRSQSSQTVAEMMRVVEVKCDFQSYVGTELGKYIDDCLILMRQNYGLAGPAFMRECFKNPDIFKQVAAEAVQWDQLVRVNVDERFWTYGLGIILAVGRLAVKLGFLDFDMDELERWARENLLPTSRERVSESVQLPSTMLGEFINANIDSMLVVTAERRPTNLPLNVFDLSRDPYVKRYPFKELNMRLEIDTQTLYINYNFLSNWCVRHRISFSELKTYLLNERIWDSKVIRKTLSMGVEALGKARVKCLKLSLARADFELGVEESG